MVWNSFFVRAVYPPIFPQYQVNFPCRTLPQLLPGQNFYCPAPTLAEKVVFKSYQFLINPPLVQEVRQAAASTPLCPRNSRFRRSQASTAA